MVWNSDIYSSATFSCFALEYALRKRQADLEEMELNGIYYLLVYVDYVNLLAKEADTKNKTTEGLLIASKKADLGVNVEKTKSVCVHASWTGRRTKSQRNSNTGECYQQNKIVCINGVGTDWTQGMATNIRPIIVCLLVSYQK